MGVFRSRTTKQTKSGSKKSYVCKTWRARAKDPVTGERIEKAASDYVRMLRSCGVRTPRDPFGEDLAEMAHLLGNASAS